MTPSPSSSPPVGRGKEREFSDWGRGKRGSSPIGGEEGKDFGKGK